MKIGNTKYELNNIKFIDEFGKQQKLEFNNIYCVDCMKVLKLIPDKSIDLCIVDPPYGINITKECMGGRNTIKPNKDKKWDDTPPQKSILMNYLELVEIKLYGVAIILQS